MLIATARTNTTTYGKPVTLRQALDHLARVRPAAKPLPKRRRR